MGYSANEAMVRVDFFKDSGKWYATEAVEMKEYDHWSLNWALQEALNRALWMPEFNRLRYGGMRAVCLAPYHVYSHPVSFMIPEEGMFQNPDDTKRSKPSALKATRSDGPEIITLRAVIEGAYAETYAVRCFDGDTDSRLPVNTIRKDICLRPWPVVGDEIQIEAVRDDEDGVVPVRVSYTPRSEGVSTQLRFCECCNANVRTDDKGNCLNTRICGGTYGYRPGFRVCCSSSDAV